MFMFVDVLRCPCVAVSRAPLAALKILLSISGNFRWKKNTFQPFGTEQRIYSLQAGVPALTTSGEPQGNCKAWRKDAGSLYNGLPRPHRECIVWPYVKTCMFKKHILKIRKFFFAACGVVRIFLPLPPSSFAQRDM